MLITLVTVLTLAQEPEVNCDDPVSTVEIGICMGRELEREQARQARYFAAVLERAEGLGDRIVGADGPEVAEALRASQAAWEGYVQASCDATYAWWSDGTIRGSKALGCRIDLTRQRTHELWRAHLTYPDSTPPILPEPSGPAS